jgi:hypothetical protein
MIKHDKASNRQADRQTDGKKDEWTQVTGKNKQGPGELQHKVKDVFQLEACEENLAVLSVLFSTR